MSDKELGHNLRKRTWATAKLAAKLGFSAATKKLNIELPNSTEQAVEQAIALANEFDGMKGLMLKFGQMASYLNTGLPPKAQQALAKLQSSSTAMPYTDIKSQIESSFNKEVGELFDSFDPEAFAAASIGQVHRAVYKGQAVAVKIQYPGIRKLIESDLKNVGKLAQVLFVGSSLDGEGFADELQDRLIEECDYLLEAQRQTVIGSLWNDKEGCIVPLVIPERSTVTVLTTIFESGEGFYPFIKNASAQSRRKSSLTIFSNVFEGIFRYGFFNGDPHPGNYLFREEGGVVFLDFGCVRLFPDELLLIWKELAQAILDQNFARFKACSIDMGLVGNVKKFDWDFQWDLMQFFYQPFRSTTPYRYTHEYVKESYQRVLWQNKNRRYASLPPSMLLINRLQWGLNSILADLGAEAIYSDIFRAAVASKMEPLKGKRSRPII